MITHKYILEKQEDTESLARRLSKKAQARDIFALYGTLGVGKSVFSRAFIQNLCGKTEVPSPTFTLLQIYDAPGFEIYHYDMYRIKSPEEVFELGVEEAFVEGVSLIEWPEKMGAYLPKKHIELRFGHLGDNRRSLEIIYPDEQTAERFEK